LNNPGDPEQANEGTVFRTIVWLQPDGTSEVKTVEISRAQRQAEVAARQEMVQQRDSGSAIATTTQALIVDPSCAGSSLWLFDDYNQTGSNELCFFRNPADPPGEADNLGYYSVRYCYGYSVLSCHYFTWQGRVRSYWAGVSGGAFVDRAGPLQMEYFQPWQRTDYASTVVQTATWLTLY
jgi:hypothetical protein